MKINTQNIQENNKYKIIYELSPEAIGILDEQGVILNMNGRVFDWLGYKPEEIIGKHILQVPYLTEEGRLKIKKNFAQRMEGKEVPPYEIDFIAKNGKNMVGRVLASPIKDRNKKIIGDIVMISDITERKKIEKALRDSEEKYRRLVEKMPEVIYSLDRSGNILTVNKALKTMFGFEPEEIIGKNLAEFIKKETLPQTMRDFERILTGEKADTETIILDRHGKAHNVESISTPIKKEGKVVGLQGIVRDITEQKRVDRAKTEFVSLASHQLRTPLTTISWYTEVLLRQESTKADERLKEYLENIYQSNKRLIELVNALLNVSRIELGTFSIEPEPVNLIKLAGDVVNEFLQQIKKKRLKVVSSFGNNLPLINADPNIIRNIFQNLFSNAIKYTPRGGSFEFLIKKQNPYILIKVSDTGYGIPKNEQSQVFTKFFRADNIKDKEPDGTGLGLYIVKTIVEQSGGKIWFESEENQGTTFYILIPLSGMKSKKGTKQLN